jgi:predicted Mrr-cat superfamily restriction endonuclease
MGNKAFVLRIAPSGIDRVPEALKEGQLIIGWADARGLLNQELDWDRFREIIRTTCYADETNLRRAGAAAGHMWRFIRGMEAGSRVVVPYGSGFYLAEVAGPALYEEGKVSEDSAYRRPVTWLNGKKPIPRSLAKSALISRMKTQGTCADATDLLDQINECLGTAASGEAPSFQGDLQSRLIRETLRELRGGRMDSFGFERLIQTVLAGLGAVESWIVPRNQDKGVNVLAIFRVAGVFRQVVAIQAKHWQPDPPVGRTVVEQLIRGIEEGTERATLGMVVTCGTIGEDAYSAAAAYTEEKGIPIELMDGEQFAKLIVEHGIRRTQL